MKCKTIIEFTSDYGSGTCTFHCEREEGHEGPHVETGFNDSVPYTLVWEVTMPEKAEEVPIEEMAKV